VATALTLVFVPALYATWFRVKPEAQVLPAEPSTNSLLLETP
jgi:hypothetical protein